MTLCTLYMVLILFPRRVLRPEAPRFLALLLLHASLLPLCQWLGYDFESQVAQSALNSEVEYLI